MNWQRRICMRISWCVVTAWFLAASGSAADPRTPIRVLLDDRQPQALFAFEEVASSVGEAGRAALSEAGREAEGPRIVLATIADAAVVAQMKSAGAAPSKNLKPEGFSIRATGPVGRKTYWVVGADSGGMMYGGLELAEIARIGGLPEVSSIDQNPYLAMRGTKFNLPLDVRTPTYTEPSDAAQKNMPEMWNFDFWKEYVDHLARHRYNFVSLWSLHPFPSMVKVPGYEAVALDDVRRSTALWEEDYDLNGKGFDAPEIVDDFETLKTMTIEEKIDFWREVMRYAKGRNIDFYVVTWNIFVNGTAGKYGITDEIANPVTRDYFRASVRQMLLTYPDLAGVGLTTGENMHGASFDEKEDWAFDTYARGVLDVAAEHPDRRITLIHRQHQAGAQDIARKFRPLIETAGIDFLFSFKYAQAHVFSSTTQPFHRRFVEDIRGMKTIWTLRNDDNYYFRWGAPDFVREFLRNIPYEVSQGYYYGSDQWVWGREFLSKDPETPRQIELAKHWYHWMLWGRLGYDPAVPNQRFAAILGERFPQVSGSDLLNAWQEASMIYPVTTGFHWGALDFQWYIEACKSRPGPAQTETGFHDVNRFITLAPHAGTDNLSIPDYVQAVASGKKPSGTTPVEVSERLHRHANTALQALDRMSHEGDPELRQTLEDIRAIAFLGRYYGHKIRGATELALGRESGEPAHQQAAIDELNRAAGAWRRYASTALGQYENPVWTNRVGHCDWRKLFLSVLDDVRIAGGEPDLPSVDPTPGGRILEAESADCRGLQASSDRAGFTGAGYLQPDGSRGPRWVEWVAEAPAAGRYLLELRYATAEPGEVPCAVTVNEQPAGMLVCWTTGGAETWAWDRHPVVLAKGPNRIRLAVAGPVAVDHLNVLPQLPPEPARD